MTLDQVTEELHKHGFRRYIPDKHRIVAGTRRVKSHLSRLFWKAVTPTFTSLPLISNTLAYLLHEDTASEGMGYATAAKTAVESTLMYLIGRYVSSAHSKVIVDEEKYRLIIEQAPAGIYSIDCTNNRFTSVNNVVCNFLGYTKEALLKLEPMSILNQGSREIFLENIRNAANDKRASDTLEYKLIDKAGKPRWIMSVNRYSYKSGMVKSIHAVTYDITERRMAVERIAELARIVDSSEDAIIGFGTDGIIQSWNKGAEMLYGYTSKEVIGKDFSFLIPEGFRVEMDSILGNVKNGEHLPIYETQRLKKDGSIVDVAIKVSYVSDTYGNVIGASSIVRDISERKKLERDRDSLQAKLERMAITDQLTNLYNRRHFDESLALEVGRAKRHENPLSLLILDIDHFKRYNDTYGHQAGDVVLRNLADILSANSRSTDILCRYGGEEYGVILPETDINGAANFAEKIRRQFKCQSAIQNIDYCITKTLSVGVSEYKIGDTPESLLKRADDNLYYAKNTGRDKVITNMYYDVISVLSSILVTYENKVIPRNYRNLRQ